MNHTKYECGNNFIFLIISVTGVLSLRDLIYYGDNLSYFRPEKITFCLVCIIMSLYSFRFGTPPNFAKKNNDNSSDIPLPQFRIHSCKEEEKELLRE